MVQKSRQTPGGFGEVHDVWVMRIPTNSSVGLNNQEVPRPPSQPKVPDGLRHIGLPGDH